MKKIKLWQWRVFSGIICLLKEEWKKKTALAYHLSNPPLFSLVVQSPFQLNRLLLSEMQMFSWVTFLWNIIAWGLIHAWGTHTRLERGLQLPFENTENDGMAVWPQQLKPLLISFTHGPSGLRMAYLWAFKRLLHTNLFGDRVSRLRSVVTWGQLGLNKQTMLEWPIWSAYWVIVHCVRFRIKNDLGDINSTTVKHTRLLYSYHYFFPHSSSLTAISRCPITRADVEQGFLWMCVQWKRDIMRLW